MASYKYELNKEDGKKILIGFGVAIIGAAITFVSDAIPMVDWGEWTPVVVAVSSTLVNLARKFLAGYNKF